MTAAPGTRFRDALDSLAGCLACGDLADSVELAEEPPLLATRFAAGPGAAAALGAGAAVAGRIGAARGLASAGPGAVSLSSRHVEASLLSFAHLEFEDPDMAPAARLEPEARTAAAGFLQAADGRWVYLHPGFPHNTRGLLKLLGVPDDSDRVRAAVAARPARALEDAIAGAGLCGAMVRTAEEWDASPAGALLASRPVVEVIQLGDSAPEPLPEGADRPLDGVRVLDLTRVLAGPACARTLASYGARALRVGAEHVPTIPLFVADTGFGKRFTHLDLTRPDATQTLRRLVRQADVFSQGYRTGVMDRLGFGVSEAVQLRPGLVYVSINCYGHEGDWRGRPGWEQLAQTVTGIAHAHGAHTGAEAPVLLPAAVTDYTTGYLAALGVLVALERRARVGGSYWVRVSLARTGMWLRGLGLRDGLEAMPMTENERHRWRDRMDSDWGPVRYLRPAVRLAGTEVGWALPPPRPGAHTPEFL